MSAVDTLYGLYHRSPVAFQNLMVSAYGYILKRRRYGDEHDRTLKKLLEMMSWDRERLAAHQLQQLQATLQYAQQWVPHYRDLWRQIGFDARDVKRVEDIKQIPPLEKDTLKADPKRLVSEEYEFRSLFPGNTSGTTGKPVTTFKDRGCYQRVWAYQERQRRIWGITGERPRISIGVRPVVPMDHRKPPFWRYDISEDNWHFSNFHMSEATLDAYVQKAAEIQPEEINAYPSGVYLLAAHALKLGEKRIRPTAVITCAETLYVEQRATIEAAFECKIADQYGAAEVVFWAAQCPQGSEYHIAPEFGLMEAVGPDGDWIWDEPGDALGTGFVNRAQVLIRYRLGDAVVLPRETRDCACGWKTPMMKQVIGRIDDTLYTPDGRALGRLDIVLKKVPGVLEAQLVQDARDHLTVNLVPIAGRVEAAESLIRERIQGYFGPDMRLDFAWVEKIARTASGKFRFQINKAGKPETWGDRVGV
jgi:phenylacetate-CoA ligase